MFIRAVPLHALLPKKSLFLFGPRGAGKSFWIQRNLPEVFRIDLLKSQLFLRLSATPSDLERLIPPHAKAVVIDEVQKIPILLDEVHRLIEEKGIHFLLTGSSARKLKKEGANMLGGRAWVQYFHPLSYSEIPDFNLNRILSYGGLPSVYLSNNPEDDLHAYIETYLKEEIQIEAKLRNLSQFSRFLKVAALSNGQMINYAQIGSDAEAPASTVREYFQLLQDTLLGFTVAPWRESKKRKAIQAEKFYFSDIGISNAILNNFQLDPQTDRYGALFEHWIALEMKTYLHYRRIYKELHYWRTTQKDEVDFVVDADIAIEVKSTRKVKFKEMTRGLVTLSKEKNFKNLILVTHDPTEIHQDGIQCLHWKTFIKKLWADEWISRSSSILPT